MNEEVYPWQRRAWAQFEDAVLQDRLVQTIMVSAVPGLGLDWFVRCQCSYLLNLPAERLRTDEVVHPDLQWVRREPNPGTSSDVPREKIVIQQARALAEFLYQKPTGTRKIAVIELVEDCTPGAVNALLKPLEEPARATHVILISHAPGRVPATIFSRCSHLHVGLPDPDEAMSWLTGTDACKKRWALSMTAGAPVLAQTLIETGLLDDLMELDEALSAMLAEGHLHWPVIEQLAAQDKLLINQFLMRLLLFAGRIEPDCPFKATDALRSLPQARLIQLMDDGLDRRRKIYEVPTLNSEWLLAGQLQAWLTACR